MPTIKDIAPESVFTIELNAGTPGRQGPKGEQGIQGIQGPKGEPGPKPIRGIDYFTQQDISNMVTTITGNSNSAFNENVANKTKEFNENVAVKTSAFDNNAVLKTEEFNANANSKKTDFNLNANNRTTEFNTNASNKKNEIDTYVTNKTTEFDKHVENKVNEFKEETSEYVTETELESKGYLVESDLNGYAKEEDLFSGSYNDLKDKPKIPNKTSELTNDKGFINEIPSEYVTEEEQEEFIKPYNKRITTNEKYISELEATIDILTNTDTAKGELVHITDALGLPVFETKTSGNVKQETTKGNQLFNYKDISTISAGVTTDEDGWVTITADNTNGTAEIYKNFFTNRSDLLKENTKYKVVLEIKNINQSDKTKISYINILGIEEVTQFQKAKTIRLNELSIGTFIYDALTKESFEGTTMMARNFIAVSVGDNISITFRLSVLEDTTVTPETFVYEKYTGNQASPNPEFPSEIEVLEAYNRFNINTITENKYINADIGSIETSSVSNISDYIEIKHNKKLTLTYNYISLMNTGNRAIVYYDANKNFLRGFSYNPTNKSVLIGTPSDAKFIRFTYDKSFYDIQIVDGSPKPYLSYGCVGVKVSGKNKANIDKNYTFTGLVDITDLLDLTPNTDYIISCKSVVKGGSEFPYVRIGDRFLSLTGENEWSFTTGDTKGNCYIYSNGTSASNSAGITTTVNELMIRLATITDNIYEPYQEQIVYLDLKGNWVGKINDDIRDYLVTDKKKYWLVKNVGKIVLDGTNGFWDYVTSNKYFFVSGMTDNYIKNSTDVVCNYYLGGDASIHSIDNVIKTGNAYNFMIKDTRFTNVEEFKIFLSENKPEVYYPLATPEIIELGELPEPIKTFEGVNNIQLLANLDTEIEVKYALDVKKYFDNKLAEISAQII